MCKQSILEVGTSLSLNKAGITGLLGSFRTDQSGFFLKWEVVGVDTVFCAEHVSTTITAFDSSCSSFSSLRNQHRHIKDSQDGEKPWFRVRRRGMACSGNMSRRTLWERLFSFGLPLLAQVLYCGSFRTLH